MMRRLSGVLLALTMAGLAACERPADQSLFSPQAISGPQAVVTPTTPANPDLSQVVLLKGDPAVAEQTVTKVVYKTGKLVIGPNYLNIWQAPLAEPLVFTLTIKQKPYLTADMSAVKLSDGTPVTTFKAPLNLRLSYAQSTTPIPDVSKLKIYYQVNGVVVEQTVSGVDKKGQAVYANITHFSEYSPGLDGMQ